jgi:hypothetical protein
MSTERTRTPTDDLLNRLYWDSLKTVDEIVGEMGIGRNSLYLSIQPLEAGAECVQCEAPMYFNNRTQRSAGTAACLVCGSATTIVRDPAPAADGEPRAEGWRAGLKSVTPDRAAMIGSAAALGLVVGATATRVIRH